MEFGSSDKAPIASYTLNGQKLPFVGDQTNGADSTMKDLEEAKKELERLRMADKKAKIEMEKLIGENQQLKSRVKYLEKNEKTTQVEIEDLKLNRRKLRTDVDNLTRRLANSSNGVNIECLKEKIVKLKRELAGVTTEAECWKYNYEKIINERLMTESLQLIERDYGSPIVYYTKFVKQGENLLKTANDDLDKLLRKSKDKMVKTRAQRELLDFKITAICLMDKAKENLKILKAPNCDKEHLLKVDTYPAPFSPLIYSKMG